MEDIIYLPDQHHIEKIRENLWCEREYGNVSIMVGAGFSLNADKLSSNSDSFLLWSQLGEKMKAGLYPYSSNYNQDVLKLASEYEEVFGRQALDELIISSLPDENYVPGILHKMLLSLPWADVYTTNYDTLLERTTKYIYDRKYNLVLNTSDIPNRMKPRIVKLHGSFPSHRPFIFSEEDYRTYPKKYAPFVNMVQQTIMENILCLIGFSGDDPNFLNWIGWVRDNLGENTPPIYFCGFVSSTQRRMLEARGITPIDFSPLFPEYKYPGVLKHKKALEWFLLNLKYGRKADVLRWPNLETNVQGKHEDLPYIPVRNSDIPKSEMDFGFNKEVEAKDLLKILKDWKHTRLLHPGWIITPKNNRDNLWRETGKEIYHILNNIDKLTLVDALMLLYELNWRIETSLAPLYTEYISKMVVIIEKFNAIFQTKNIYRSQEKLKDFKSNLTSNIDWQLLQKCWVELIFAIIREARGDHNVAEFDCWMDTIEDVVKQSPEWTSRWYYEKALFNLFKLDQEGIQRVFKEWPRNKNFPFWQVKRASILAELGEMREAERECEEALEDIRIRLQANRVDISLLSQEGWTMVLLRSIKNNAWLENDFGEYRDRWTKLSQYKCNPFQEVDVMDSLLKDSVPKWKGNVSVTQEFDPGIITRHYSYGDVFEEEIRLSFAFLRLFEEVAMPKRSGIVTMYKKSVINATKWIEHSAPMLAMSALIRTGDAKEIKKIFTREFIISLTEEQVEIFYELFVPSLEQAMSRLSQEEDITGFSSRLLPNLIEIISRIYIRFSKEKKVKIFNLMIKMYNSREIHQFHLVHSQLNYMFKRVLYDMSDMEIYQKLSMLLELPILGEEGFNVEKRLGWFEPFTHIKWSENYKANRKDPAWSNDIKRLIRLVGNSKNSTRDNAIVRLSRLFEINGLTKEQCEEFTEALYCRIDQQTQLPCTLRFYNSFLLHLPKKEEEQVKQNFYSWIVKQDIPSIFTENGGYSGGNELNRFVAEWINSAPSMFLDIAEDTDINYSEEDCMKLLKKILAWWKKERLNKFNQDVFHGNPEDQMYNLTYLMVSVIFLKLKSIDEITKKEIRGLLEDLKEKGIEISHVLPATLHLEIYDINYIYQILKKDLESIDKDRVKYSSKGCLYWIIYGQRGIVPEIPSVLFDNWINKIYSRRQPKLNNLLGDIGDCILYFPNVLNEMHWNYVLDGLEYLIEEVDINILTKEREYQLFPNSEFALYRELCVRLAGIAYKVYKEKGKDIPDILIKWKEICKNEKLPEVRKKLYLFVRETK
ncbi:SIR2 family NAD-dependent protein deacylase [Bacillus thuringiensis]|uniref:SIR2 family NAD-dependent protein deacylase n=1 Tax=Bacillus thuringiensis TaxID=1428 RepID=UPI000BA1E1AA|nr:SIR2 family protein [Bacillus thuringiensis]